MAAACFLSRYLSGHLPYVRHHITVYSFLVWTICHERKIFILSVISLFVLVLFLYLLFSACVCTHLLVRNLVFLRNFLLLIHSGFLVGVFL